MLIVLKVSVFFNAASRNNLDAEQKLQGSSLYILIYIGSKFLKTALNSKVLLHT